MSQKSIPDLASHVCKLVRGLSRGKISRPERDSDSPWLEACRRDQDAILSAELTSLDSLTHGFGR